MTLDWTRAEFFMSLTLGVGALWMVVLRMRGHSRALLFCASYLVPASVGLMYQAWGGEFDVWKWVVVVVDAVLTVAFIVGTWDEASSMSRLLAELNAGRLEIARLRAETAELKLVQEEERACRAEALANSNAEKVHLLLAEVARARN